MNENKVSKTENISPIENTRKQKINLSVDPQSNSLSNISHNFSKWALNFKSQMVSSDFTWGAQFRTAFGK